VPAVCAVAWPELPKLGGRKVIAAWPLGKFGAIDHKLDDWMIVAMFKPHIRTIRAMCVTCALGV